MQQVIVTFLSRERNVGQAPVKTANDADKLALVQARVAKKDPAAIYRLGQTYFFGELGLQKDMRKAVEMYTEAAKLGSVDALYSLGLAR